MYPDIANVAYTPSKRETWGQERVKKLLSKMVESV